MNCAFWTAIQFMIDTYLFNFHIISGLHFIPHHFYLGLKFTLWSLPALCQIGGKTLRDFCFFYLNFLCFSYINIVLQIWRGSLFLTVSAFSLDFWNFLYKLCISNKNVISSYHFTLLIFISKVLVFPSSLRGSSVVFLVFSTTPQ